MASFKSILKKAGEFFQNLEKKRLILLITVAVIVVAAGIVGAILLNQVHYTVLFSGLDASEAGTIKTVLDGKGVKSEVQGTTILVPEDQADNLRIELASQGYPSTGLNYNIFSNSSQLGSTDLERRTYLQYQLQENIRATLKHMDKVQDAIVIANLADTSSFVVSDKQSEATVAVQLSLKNGQKLTNDEAKTIQEFVLKCVPNLKPENVSIVDSKMNYYDVSDDNSDATAATYTTSQLQLTQQMKDVLSKQALNVLEPALGTGNVAVSVNLNLNFDKQTVNKVEFAPPVDGSDNGLLRSSQEVLNGTTSTTGASGVPGTNTNGSGTPAYVAASPSPASSSQNSSSKTYNYELNQVQTQIEKAQGTIQNLSVAVLVNSTVKGVDSYTSNIKNLVAQSIGVKPDYISVELMPFVSNNDAANAFQQAQQTAKTVSSNSMITTIVAIVAALAAIVIIGMFFFKKPVRPAREPALEGAAHAGAGHPVRIGGGDFEAVAEDTYEMPDLVLKKSTEAEAIEELMDRYPETVAQILRTWLAEDY